MRPRVAQTGHERLGEAHLLAKRRCIVRLGRNDHRLASAIADRAEQQVDADRCDVKELHWNGARWQAFAATHGATPYTMHELTAELGVMEDEAGVPAAGRA